MPIGIGLELPTSELSTFGDVSTGLLAGYVYLEQAFQCEMSNLMTERLLVVLTLGFHRRFQGAVTSEGSKDPGDAMIGVDAINVDAGWALTKA